MWVGRYVSWKVLTKSLTRSERLVFFIGSNTGVGDDSTSGWPQRWVLDDCGGMPKNPWFTVGNCCLFIFYGRESRHLQPSSNPLIVKHCFFGRAQKRCFFFLVFLFGRKPSNSFFFVNFAWWRLGTDADQDIWYIWFVSNQSMNSNEEWRPMLFPYTKIFHPSPTSTHHREESNFLKKGLLKFRVSTPEIWGALLIFWKRVKLFLQVVVYVFCGGKDLEIWNVCLVWPYFQWVQLLVDSGG